MRTVRIALRIWLITNFVFALSWLLYVFFEESMPLWSVLIAALCSLIGSLPTILILSIGLSLIKKSAASVTTKKLRFLAVCTTLSLVYGCGLGLLLNAAFEYNHLFTASVTGAGVLLFCSLTAITLSSTQLTTYFFIINQFTLNKYTNMETNVYPESVQESTKPASSNTILYKGMITGVLILVMLIPTFFINNLVKERQERQAQVSNEVSEKWAKAQTLTGPYIYLPYKKMIVDKDKKVSEQLSHLLIIPDNLAVNGSVSNELRQRSIYKVLLYNATISNTGNFQFHIPKDIDSNLINWQDARICYGISDFKGIEERLVIKIGESSYELSPGLPANDIDEKGLSAPIPLSSNDEGKKIAFAINVKIKGSEQLHFVPLSGDSRFTLQSSWANPSFDGSDLPSVRTVTDSGFTVTWAFNKANLPFGTVLNDFKYDQKDLAFGVTMVQPADGYAKTDRCIKYAILFIGLTFSLFFIVEIMQKKPLHPVQYVLVGLALVIFYTLLLSISEFLPFDWSYLIAAIATILLVSFYAYGHFQNIGTTAVFGSILSLLYGFTFILIRLEDTALLIGSIGLFIILAIAMYFSRKINWYGHESVSATV